MKKFQPGLTHCSLPSRSGCKRRVEEERELCCCFTRCNHLLTYIIHHTFKSSYHDRKASLVIKKLREDPNEIPSQSRDTITVMAYNLFREKSCQILMWKIFIKKLRKDPINKLHVSEKHLVSSKLKGLIWNEVLDFHTQLLSSPNPATLKKLDS